MQGEYIKKEAWDKILIFLKDAKGVYLCNEKNCKFFFEAIYWIVRTGAQWRELPERYGNWNTIYKRFNAWSRRGIWENFFVTVSRSLIWSTLCLIQQLCEHTRARRAMVSKKQKHLEEAGEGFQQKFMPKLMHLAIH